MNRVLIIGYGNPDREDDGVAWHILQALSSRYGCPVLETDGDISGQAGNLQLVFTLQLTPEMAEPIAGYERVCFVDAHTGAYADEVRAVTVQPGFQASPFTHHLTPESCLSLAETLYGHAPPALVVSVRGYRFGYRRGLSPQTERLVTVAVERITTWLSA
ncbi:MAG: hydrogenase maturation protease [Chloroflexi bacterium]|nr:MAG: hydrogenase maturation protease [Chloroflexota bacterium]